MTYRKVVKISHNKTVTLEELPFQPGDQVEVIIKSPKKNHTKEYPLRGMKIEYYDPYESAETHWDVMK